MNTSDLFIAQIMANLATLQNRFTVERCRQAKVAMASAGFVPFRLPAAWDRGPGRTVVKSFDPVIRQLMEDMWMWALHGKPCAHIAGLLRRTHPALLLVGGSPCFSTISDNSPHSSESANTSVWATIPPHSPANRQYIGNTFDLEMGFGFASPWVR
jgi:hypothetical protein